MCGFRPPREAATGPGTLWPLLGVLVTIWGLNYLFVTVGLTGSGPLWLATLRSGIGLTGMVILVTAARGWTVFDLRAKRDALLLGIPNTALFFGLWFLAARSVPPGIASVVIYTFPLWVALLSAPVLGRPLPAVAWASVALGFVGVALIAQFWSLAGVSGAGRGDRRTWGRIRELGVRDRALPAALSVTGDPAGERLPTRRGICSAVGRIGGTGAVVPAHSHLGRHRLGPMVGAGRDRRRVCDLVHPARPDPGGPDQRLSLSRPRGRADRLGRVLR